MISIWISHEFDPNRSSLLFQINNDSYSNQSLLQFQDKNEPNWNTKTYNLNISWIQSESTMSWIPKSHDFKNKKSWISHEFDPNQTWLLFQNNNDFKSKLILSLAQNIHYFKSRTKLNIIRNKKTHNPN